MIDKSTRQHYESQGGMKNYLGNQEMVEAPKYWKSRPDKPETELAYITKAEKDLIMRSDLHGSLNPNVKGNFAPNEGPSGLMSLDYQGDKDTYGDPGQSYGDKERYTSTDVTGPENIHGGTTRTIGPTTPKDTFEQSWTGPKGWFGGGGYKDLKTPGYTAGGHKSGFNPLAMILGLINPALGMAVRGFQGMKDFSKHDTLADWWGNRSNWGDKTDDMSQYSDLGLYTDRQKQKAFNEEALTTDRFSDMKLANYDKTQNTGILSNANKYTNAIGPNSFLEGEVDALDAGTEYNREKTLEEIDNEDPSLTYYKMMYGGS